MKYLETNMARVAPTVEAKDTIMTAVCISKMKPDSKPRRSATGKESVVSKI